MLTLSKPGIEEYAEKMSQRPSALLDELFKETHAKTKYPQMLTGPLEGNLLRMMIAVTGAKRVLEIGTFTGYSALSMAEALPADGHLDTLEIDSGNIAIAQAFFDRSENGKKIQIHEGPALTSLAKLAGPYDLVFIDADKTNYKNYYEAVVPKVRQNGVILIDNVLWSGRVLEPQDDDDRAICALNEFVAKDERVDRVLLTVRDGVFFIRKR